MADHFKHIPQRWQKFNKDVTFCRAHFSAAVDQTDDPHKATCPACKAAWNDRFPDNPVAA